MATVLRNWISALPRLTGKLLYVILCLLASTLFMLFQGGKLAFMLFTIMSLLSLYLWLGRWSGISRARGARELMNMDKGKMIEAGSSVSVSIQVQIPGLWPIPYVMLKDRLIRKNGGEFAFETSIVPDYRRRGSVEYVTKPLQRGFYHFSDAICSTEDIFGMFQHTGKLSLYESFMVKPQTVAIKEWKQFHQAFKGHHYHSTTTQALRETTQINGVREYIYGDRISRIHWNATAKTGTWKSKEFERESLPKTVIMIDRNRANYSSSEQFELAVSIAASLFQYGSAKDLAMGLLSVGSSAVYLEPNRVASHYQGVNQHLIDIELDGAYPLLSILQDRARYFSQGCFFVIISPLMDESMMKSLHWISQRQMNPCHFAVGQSGRTPQVEDWLRRLRTRGMLAYAVPELNDLPVALGGSR